MTKPKSRPCPVCGAPNPVQVKTCTSCAWSLPVRDKISKLQADLKSKNWAHTVKKNHNSNRVVTSSLMSMAKLNALGYQPILFMTKKSKCGQMKGDLVHFLQPEGVHIEIIQEMQRLYELLIQTTATASDAHFSPFSPEAGAVDPEAAPIETEDGPLELEDDPSTPPEDHSAAEDGPSAPLEHSAAEDGPSGSVEGPSVSLTAAK